MAGSDGHGRALGAIVQDVPGVVEVIAGDTDPFPGPEAGPVVTGISAHSGRVLPGYLFVAVRGTKTDGHRYIGEALERGARALMVDRPGVLSELRDGRLRGRQAPWVVRVADTSVALAWAAASFYGHPARTLDVVGVTGTVGKTSVSLYLRGLLQAAGRRAGAVGSLGIFTERGHEPSPLTTPDPITLQRALHEMVQEGLSQAVIEVSSHGLMQHRVEAIRLAGGVITEILPFEHAEAHPSFEHYLATKRRFLELLRPDAFLAYSAHSPHTRAMAELWPRPRRVAFALGDEIALEDAAWSVVGRIEGASLDGTRVHVRWRAPGRKDVDAVVSLHLLGAHAVHNVLGAAAAALASGLSFERVVEGMGRLRPLPRRMNPIHRGEFTVIDDTTGHPASFEHLFQTLEAIGAPRIVLLVGVRGSRGADINARNGRIIAAWARRLPVAAIVTTESEDAVGPGDRVEPRERDALLGALQDVTVRIVEHRRTLEQAMRTALDIVRPGDLLVFAGAQALNQAASLFWLHERNSRPRGQHLPGSQASSSTCRCSR
ncbi:MAG: hypothetical protein IMX02_10540 [Limnochordaceae bacterium]|nr:hypothetical protein [Limnochordaceae bacterium]